MADDVLAFDLSRVTRGIGDRLEWTTDRDLIPRGISFEVGFGSEFGDHSLRDSVRVVYPSYARCFSRR